MRGAVLDPFRALYLATAGGARALGLGDRIGGLQVGQEADFVLPQAVEALTRSDILAMSWVEGVAVESLADAAQALRDRIAHLLIGLLFREARFHAAAKPAGFLGAYVVGLAFAFGWTPCIGPILAAILSVAASEETVAKGAGLLAVYSAGLGIPFLIAALMIEQFSAVFARMRRHLATVERVMGVLMILVGIGFLTGAISDVSIWLLETFPALQNVG